MKELPLDLHFEILGYLNAHEMSEYSLVCKHWLEPARYMLYRTHCLEVGEEMDHYMDHPEIMSMRGRYVKEVIFCLNFIDQNMSQSNQPALLEKRARQYADYIEHAPNVTTVTLEKAWDIPSTRASVNERLAFYGALMEALQQNKWTHLYCIDDWDMMPPQSRVEFNIELPPLSIEEELIFSYYYRILSVIQDRVSSVALDATPVSNSDSHCFQSPLSINRETRFPKAESLTCWFKKTTTIRSLEDIITLCPAATKATLVFYTMVEGESKGRTIGKERTITANYKIRNLTIWTSVPSNAVLEYIYLKFQHLDRLQLLMAHASYHCDASKSMMNTLCNYLSMLSSYEVSLPHTGYELELLGLFTRTLCPTKLMVTLNPLSFESSTGLSALTFDPSLVDVSSEPTCLPFLSQLDQMNLTTEEPAMLVPAFYEPYARHCKQLKEITFCKYVLYELESTLPFTQLELSECTILPQFWLTLSYFMPQLQCLNVDSFFLEEDEPSSYRTTLKMPWTSFHQFNWATLPCGQMDTFYLKLTRSGITRYYQHAEEGVFLKNLKEIKSDEFEEQTKDNQVAVMELYCRDIQSLELEYMDLSSGGCFTIQHQF
ncbi:hypothetical protein BD560DRAFT_381267 [Blakeslea trispora]|nr:hypothetical protein BD560DRAFT_381267 [Blakeslea trispora]